MPRVYSAFENRYVEVDDETYSSLKRPVDPGQPSRRQIYSPFSGRYHELSPEDEAIFYPKHPPPNWQPLKEDAGVTLADAGRLIMAGGAHVGASLGWLIDKIDGEMGVGEAIENLGSRAVDYWNESLSDSARDALSREFVRKNEQGEYEWGDPTLATVGLLGAQSLLGTAAGAGLGAGATRVLQTFANPAGRAALARAAAGGSAAAAGKVQMIDRITGAAGFGAGEGTIGGASAGFSVKDAVTSLSDEELYSNERFRQVYDSTTGLMDQDAAWEYAKQTIAEEASSMAGMQAGLTTALLGAPMGAYFGPLFSKVATGATGSVTKGAAGEAAQEFLQSGAEQYISNVQVGRAGGDVDPWQDVLNAAIGGAAAGAPIGGVFATAEYAGEQRAQKRKQEQPEVETKVDGVDYKPLVEIANRAIELGVPPEELLPIIERAKEQGQLVPSIKAVRDIVKRYEEQAAERPQSEEAAAPEAPESEVAAEAPPEPEAPERPSVPHGPFFRGARRGDQRGSWWTTDREAAEDYAGAWDGDVAETDSLPLENPATSVDIQSVLAEMGEDVPLRDAGYFHLSPEQYERADEVLARLKERGHDGVFLQKGEDFSPSGKEIESVMVFDSAEPAAEQPEKSSAPATPEELDSLAQQAATSPTNDLPEPTEAQKDAGNYRKPQVKLPNLPPIRIENPDGSERTGTNRDGTEWSRTMEGVHYGYFERTAGADNEDDGTPREGVDVFVGQNATDPALPAFVIDQKNADGTFDEHKVMLGFATEQEARAAYQAQYDEGWGGIGAITEMSTDDLREFLADEQRTSGPVAYREGVIDLDEHRREAGPTRSELIEIGRAQAEASGEYDMDNDQLAELGDEIVSMAGFDREEMPQPTRTFQEGEVVDFERPPEPEPSSEKSDEPEIPVESTTEPEALAAEPVETSQQEPEPQEAESPSQPPAETPEKVLIAEHFAKLFADGRRFRLITEARKEAATITGQPIKAGTPEAKIADEAIEVGVVMRAREIVAAGGDPKAIYDQLVDLYSRMPKLGTRTSTSVSQQAYSTPIPLAYLAAQAAGIAPESSVYEPTAGNGALLLTANPENTVANELNADRAEALRQVMPEASVSTENAAEWRPPGDFDVVIANPPFGAVRDENDETIRFQVNQRYETGEIDHAITFKALEAMQDNGSAVLIVGSVAKTARTEEARSDAYNGKAKREFYLSLYEEYNVVDHFTVPGSLYERQGAGWPVDVIVIRGRGKSANPVPAVNPPRVYKSWDQLSEVLNAEYPNAEAGDRAAPRGDAQQPRGPATGDAGARAGGGATQPDRRPQPAPDGGPVGVRQGSVDGQPSDSGQAQPERPRDTQPAVDNRPAERPRRTAPVVEGENARQVAYRPASSARSMETLVPVNMQTAIGRSLDNLESNVGGLDKYVADQLGYTEEELPDYFGAEQVDAIALALSNMRKNAGFIIGDQTGIGKGRVVAAIIRYAIKTGRVPIFVTEKPNLYGDMYRDIVDIGLPKMLGREPRMMMTNAGEKVPLDEDETVWLKASPATRHNKDLAKLAATGRIGDNDIVFTTYSQMQTVRGAETVRQQFLRSIAPNSIVIFDESHNAGGAQKSDRESKNKAISRAEFARELTRSAQGVFYSSGTYAKRPDVMDLYATTDMRLAVPDVTDIGPAISKGGVPMQQIVASMLAESGQYVRRERSFDGVVYNSPVTSVDRGVYSSYSQVLATVQNFSERYIKAAVKAMDKDLKAAGRQVSGDNATGGAGAKSTAFSSIMHNLIDQMLLSIKAGEAADRAIKAWKNGEKSVVTVANTMGAFIQDYVEDMSASNGDRLDLTFNSMLLRYLERTRRVSIRQPFMKKGEKGEHIYLTDEHLGPSGVAAYEAAKALIESLDLSALPVSPIDFMKKKMEDAGMKVGEITGRQVMLEYRDGGNFYKVRPGREVSIRGRRRTISAFNAGRSDAVILNQAGSTGLSLHASETFKDQKKRRMIIAQAERNIDTHMQILGRVHRTGQVIEPEYDQLVADIPAEKRPAAVLANKMASLNANTTASRGGALTAKDVPDFMNEYGDTVARRLMQDNPDLERQLGDPLKGDDEEAMRKVTGRIPLLPLEEQEAVYELLESEYNALLQQAEATGQSTLEAKTLPLDAKIVERKQVVEPTAANSPFAAGVDLEYLDVKRVGKPHPTAKVIEMAAESVGIDPKGLSAENKIGLLQAGKQQARELHGEARRDLQAYKVEVLDALEGDAQRAALEKKLDQALDKVQSIITRAPVGESVRLVTDQGNFYGVVTKVARTGKTKNPVAPSSWKMTVALADVSKQITVPFSQLSLQRSAGSVQGPGGIILERAQNIIPGMSVYEAFDQFQAETRERRYMLTGNILAGFDHVGGRGSIVNFTDDQGQVRQGIMLPKNYDYEQEQSEKPVEFRSAEQVLRFVREGNVARTSKVEGGVAIKMVGNDIRIEVPAAKSVGGRFYLSQPLLRVVGQDFVKAGDDMRVDVSMDAAPAVIEQMRQMGAVFKAMNNRKLARDIVGGAANEPLYSRPQSTSVEPSGRTAAEVEKQLATAIEAVSPLLTVEVVQSTDDLPGGAAPDDVEGAYYRSGTVYLVADNLPEQHAVNVFMHEVFGHAAMERHEEFPQWLAQVQKARKIKGSVVQRLAGEVAARQGGVLDPATEAKEIIALMAERGVKHSLLDRVIAAFRGLLRSIGLVKGVSKAELRSWISRAMRDFQREIDLARALPEHAETFRAAAQRSASDDQVLAAINAAYPDDNIDERREALYSRAGVIGGRARGSAEVEAAMERVMVPAREDMSLLDRARAAWRDMTNIQEGRIKQGLLDSAHSIRMLEEGLFGEALDAADSAYKATLATKNLPSVMAAVMRVGAPELRDGVFQPVEGRTGIIEMFKPITEHADGNLLAQWEFFAAANRASRLIKETNRDGTSREKNFTQEDIEIGLALEEKYPVFREVLDQWSEFNSQILDVAVASGVINAEERALWERNDYVPFYRAMADDETNAPGTKGGIADQRSGIRRLTGGEAKLGRTFENMMMNVAHLIDASFKNIAMQRVSELALETGAMEQLPKNWQPVAIDSKQIIKRLEDAGLEVTDEFGDAELAQWQLLFRRVAPQGPDIVTALWEGKPRYYRVNDPMLLSSVTAMGQNNYSALMGLFRAPKKWLTTGVTASPGFMLANLIRDTLSTWVVANVKKIPFVDAVKGMKASFQESPDIMAIMMAGAGGGGYYDSNPEQIRKLLAQQMPRNDVEGFLGSVLSPRKAWKFWQRVGASTENANRVAIFRRVIERGGSVAEAAYQARDVLNFSMSGDFAAVQVLIQTVPFLNARIQGLYRLARGFKEHPKGFTIKGLSLMAFTVALLMRNNDEPEYEELPDWDKDTYWHVWVGGEHFRIPKPFEVGAIFATLPERLFRSSTGRDDVELLAERVGVMLTETFSFNPIPQLAKPIIEQYANRNMFTGSPIVGLAEEGLEPEAQYTAWTSEAMRAMAEGMPDWAPSWMRSPRRMEAAVRAYFGTLGAYAMTMADGVTRALGGYPAPPKQTIYELPVVSRFLRDPNPRITRYQDSLYDMLNESNEVFRSINRYKAQGLIDKAREMRQENVNVLRVRRQLNQVNKAVRAINNETRKVMYTDKLTPEQKRDRIDQLKKQKNDILLKVAPFEEFY